jgi:hypothetical protein
MREMACQAGWTRQYDSDFVLDKVALICDKNSTIGAFFVSDF